ncbi:SWIM zinc finger family protein [Actinoplanes sp. NPDC051851]|uniref:SWIM zinc finger family protein n=1 Tax=Actinoplanes sp. NPDC051851 TaxID=3154753 RepID=UPI0034175392
MPDERWSLAQAEALAPDAAALKRARDVSGRFGSAGRHDEIIWGHCRGYLVAVDVSAPAFKCSCPSFKIPCKHAVGLVLLWAASGLPDGPLPDFAVFPTPLPRSAPGPAAAAKRAEKVAGGMTELRRWLDDQVTQGLAGARSFEPMAARLIDAQAPGAAATVRRLTGIAGIGPHWADRLLGELAMLRLLVTAHSRLDTLDPALAASVRSRIGFPVPAEQVLAGPRVTDHWQVLGSHDADEGPLTTRRTWLHGVATGRFALVLEFAGPGQPLTGDLLPGTGFRGDLCFHPGAGALRALVAGRASASEPFGSPAGGGSIRAGLSRWASLLSVDPFAYDGPLLLESATPTGDGFLVDAAGDALPLAAGWREPWWLLAAAGGRPATVAAQWSPDGVRPLGAWVDGRFVEPGTATAGQAGARGAELPRELLAAALVGTARRPWAGTAVRVGEVGIALSPAGDLLDTAAVALIARRAGFVADTDRVPVEAAPEENRPPLPVAAGERLARILRGGVPGGAHVEQELLAQWLAAAADRGGVVPPVTLPALLDAGRRNTTVRAEIARVAGRRGSWLAGRRADWRWLLDEAAPAPGTDWPTASGAERLGHLTALRRTDPARGRELLTGTWAEESSEDRARFLGTFADGLSLADEPLLESALDDRRREVRETASGLLRQLPGAALGRRMAERAHTAVTLTPSGRLVVRPPGELDAGLRRDGVGASPSQGAGIGAWLLEEVVAGTPPESWDALEPASYVALARSGDWSAPLLHGWAKAAIVRGDARWATALLDRDAGSLREAVRWDLHLVLPPDALARQAEEALRTGEGTAQRLLTLHPGPWPDTLSAAVLATIEQRARGDRHTWQLGELCRTAAVAMPPAYDSHTARLAAQLTDETDPIRVRPIADLTRTLTFRRSMLAELAA